MKNRWFCRRPATKPVSFFLMLVAACVYPGTARAETPEWMRSAARLTHPQYPAETNAVMLLDEQITTVRENGEIRTTYRRAYKILRPEGRSVARVVVHFDGETKIAFLKAWAITAQGKEMEAKERDAVEVALYDDLYSDTKEKVLEIPGADPGNVVGVEYEQRRRPTVLQDLWFFQDLLPVRLARFTLQLPPGWEFQPVWLNHPRQEGAAAGDNAWRWELQDLPPIEIQDSMPPWRAVAGWMAVSYFPKGGERGGKAVSTWRDVGKWYSDLSSGRRQTTPAIQAKAAALTASSQAMLDKMRSIAAYAQREIRYVSIQIGIGGYQPHMASDIFSNRYGDCKDKVTLLSTMLKEIGVNSYYMLVHTDRGMVTEQFPTPLTFNHVILAIALPPETLTGTLFALHDHPKLGKLLLFDPTDDVTPFGHLPPTLQANYGLLVTEEGGELTRLPLQPPSTNRLLRTGKLELSSAGTLSGEVTEVRWGALATSRRSAFISSEKTDRRKVLEDFLASFLTGFTLTAASVDNLEKYDENLVLSYRFVAERYAKSAGNMLLLRPRVLGQKSNSLLEGKERKYPVEFNNASHETDRFEITLPAGFKVEELPLPVEIDYGFAEYRSKVELKDNVLTYSRDYKIKDVMVGKDKLETLKKFYRQVAADERYNAVLQRSP